MARFAAATSAWSVIVTRWCASYASRMPSGSRSCGRSPLLRQQPRVIVVPFGGAALPAGLESYEDFIEGDATGYQYPAQDENEAVGMCYTSGTTGRSEGRACTRHRSTVLHAMHRRIPDLFALSARDVMMATPMFHANAWSVPFPARWWAPGWCCPARTWAAKTCST